MAGELDPDAFVVPTFGARLGGALIDGLLLVPVSLLAQLVVGVTAGRVIGWTVISLYRLAALVLFDGQTVGKRLVGTRAVSIHGGRITEPQALTRVLTEAAIVWIATLLGVPLVGGLWALLCYGFILRGPLHRGLHDMAAGTIVVNA